MDEVLTKDRSSFLDVPTSATRTEGALHLVTDSTGLKIVGDGEWHCHKHRAKNERRRWRKLHRGVRDDGIIVASGLTDSGADDAVVGAEFLEQLAVPVASFRGDGAYDTKAFYAALAKAGMRDVDIVIPPRRTAVPSRSAEGTWRQRTEALDRIAQVGRRQWRKESGAHQLARAENGGFRHKQIVGDRLRARTRKRQEAEAMIGVLVVNRMTALDKPESQAIRA